MTPPKPRDPAKKQLEILALRPLNQLIIVTRVITFMGVLAAIFLAWVLYTQHKHFALPQLQVIRLGIIVAGVVTFISSLIGSRLSLKKDQVNHEQRVQDLDEQVRANIRFRTALDFSAVPKVLVDDDDRIVFANPAFATVTGRPTETFYGTRTSDWLTPLETIPEGVPKVMESDLSVEVGYSTHLREHDQTMRTLRSYRINVPHIERDAFSQIVQFEDLTQAIEDNLILSDDRRVLEERVQQRTRALESVNSELESFAYSVSHDLRGPLRAIDGFGQVLRHTAVEKLDARELEYLDRITGATTRMGELIDSLLRMSRLSTAPLDLGDIDLSHMLQDVVLDVRTQYPDAGNVNVEIQPDLWVRGDRVLLRNTFSNLIGNSFKFTRDSAAPRIQITAQPRNRFWLEIRVSDNGVGFDQKYVDKLFRPFQRLHRNDEFEGHGIGLASVKRVVDRHGGTTQAIGALGQGATIVLTLPMPSQESDNSEPI